MGGLTTPLLGTAAVLLVAGVAAAAAPATSASSPPRAEAAGHRHAGRGALLFSHVNHQSRAAKVKSSRCHWFTGIWVLDQWQIDQRSICQHRIDDASA